MRRLTILLAAIGVLMLVPVAQAAASGLKVNLAGSGKGTLKTFGGIDLTEPPIACSGPPASGICTEESAPAGEFAYYLAAIPAEGSTFAGWTIETGSAWEPGEELCQGDALEEGYVEAFKGEPGYEGMEGLCAISPSGGNAKLTATFSSAGTPTALTIAKTGEGTVTSSPAGIECTGAKTGAECEAKFELNEMVTLTASPATGYAFSAWAGCTEHGGLTCKVKMEKAKTVKVTFVKTPLLTVEKAGTGQGKAAATGISCDENCSKATSAIKTGTLVTVKVTSAKGSEAAVFEGGTGSASGCSGASCIFTIEANSSVKVKFSPIPTKTLTVKLTGPAAYKGKVSGKGTVKGLTASAISCGTGCTTDTESFFSTDTVTLTAVAGLGYTFAGWSGSEAGTCTGTTSPCAIPTNANKTLSAEFK